MLAPQLPVGPNNRLAPFGEHPTSWRQKATSDKRPNLFDSYTQLCEQMYVLLQVLKTRVPDRVWTEQDLDSKQPTNPSFQESVMASLPLEIPIASVQLQPCPGSCSQQRQGRQKGHCPQTPASVQLTLIAAAGTSWIHRTWPNWTRRGRQLWGDSYGIQVMGKDLGRRKLLILLIFFNILYIYVAVSNWLEFRRK